ncbi:3',5'-cyclic-AMP phosphodiesterase [Pseudomonas sp. 21LCFQ010]|uniref:3',5'-cyclic-AMP phosphodiesterase n=1 Tax=Pseudomonas sp. 21LCFQ010 TaxID=2957506 RepID=UPI0020983014|nr:3',5'-cyclic-AMP phosphodiesterase [Pseudomonas sp. 21LCFQ010]MCO8162692.1 3',5'-cyclic-AMP phosphodiesterase [Pseudomonas sp. 21LCFQ010]
MPSSSIKGSSVLLVQLSDSHLFADADGTLLGMKTREGLHKVIERVQAEQPAIDLLLMTGDLSQDGSLQSYQAFRQMSEVLGAPVRWLPGNHDHWPQMSEAAQGCDVLQPVTDVGRWRVTMLNSEVEGAVFGYLADEQLQLLEQSLREAPERHHLVCLHHHPVAIGCEWMKPIGLHNADALFAVLERYPQVRAVLWGHVHQEFDQVRQGIRLLATPSTCIQFAPGSADFALDTAAPGYRWLRLHDDGRLETGVSRLVGVHFEVDLSGTGY